MSGEQPGHLQAAPKTCTAKFPVARLRACSVLWQVGCSVGRARPAPEPPHRMETQTLHRSPLSFCQEHAAKPPVPPAESWPCRLPQNLCISPIEASKMTFFRRNLEHPSRWVKPIGAGLCFAFLHAARQSCTLHSVEASTHG